MERVLDQRRTTYNWVNRGNDSELFIPFRKYKSLRLREALEKLLHCRLIIDRWSIDVYIDENADYTNKKKLSRSYANWSLQSKYLDSACGIPRRSRSTFFYSTCRSFVCLWTRGKLIYDRWDIHASTWHRMTLEINKIRSSPRYGIV